MNGNGETFTKAYSFNGCTSGNKDIRECGTCDYKGVCNYTCGQIIDIILLEEKLKNSKKD